MLDAARKAREFTAGQRKEDLVENEQLRLAVVRLIEIIGEAAGRVELETRQRAAHIPWPAIVSMRNRLIHAYFDVDLDRVWETVTDDLPPLMAQLERLLAE